MEVEGLVEGPAPVEGKSKIFFRDVTYRWDKLHHDESTDGMRDQLHQHFPTLPQPVTLVRDGPKPYGAFSWLITLPLSSPSTRAPSR